MQTASSPTRYRIPAVSTRSISMRTLQRSPHCLCREATTEPNGSAQERARSTNPKISITRPATKFLRLRRSKTALPCASPAPKNNHTHRGTLSRCDDQNLALRLSKHSKQIEDPLQEIFLRQQLQSTLRFLAGNHARLRINPLALKRARSAARSHPHTRIVAHTLDLPGVFNCVDVELRAARTKVRRRIRRKPHWRAHAFATLAKRFQI